MDIIYLGWLGTSIYLLAFLLLSFKLIPANRLYLSLNVIGSSILVFYAILIASYQIAVINSIWIMISLLAKKQKLPALEFLDNRTFTAVFIGLVTGQIGALFHGDFDLIIEMLGWISAWIYLAGYSVFLSNTINLNQYRYWNFIGPLTILPVLYMDGNWPNFTSNTVWLIIALFSIVKAKYSHQPSLQ